MFNEGCKIAYEFMLTNDQTFDGEYDLKVSLVFFNADIFTSERKNIVAKMTQESWRLWRYLFNRWYGFVPEIKRHSLGE